MWRYLGASLLVSLFVGCSDDAGDMMPMPDAGGGTDAGMADTGMGMPDTGTPDAGMPEDAGAPDDGGMEGCPPGEHMCSTGCERDRTNEPAEGCRNGCGLECPGMDAICGSDGNCSIECEAPAMIVGAICCGGEPVCSDKVAARCPLPTEEPNDTMGTAHDLGNLDDNDTMASITNLTLQTGDEDWYTFTATDSPTIAFFEVILDVTVTASNPGTMEVAMWFECADGDPDTNHEITEGTANTEFGEGVSAPVGDMGGVLGFDLDCGTTDESGVVHVRVRRTAAATACDGYDLLIHLHEEF